MGFFSPRGLRGTALARARVRSVLLVTGGEREEEEGGLGVEETGGEEVGGGL